MPQNARFALLVACLVLFSNAQAIVNACPITPPLETFLCNANEEYRSLQLIGEITILTGTSIPATNDAITEAVQNLKPFLSKGKNSVFFNTKAGDALNDFYIYWMTIINDSLPRSYEALPGYQQRMDERFTALQEKANRLRIATE